MVPEPTPNWGKRVAWLLLIWGASVAALAVVAWLIPLAMRGAGMTS